MSDFVNTIDILGDNVVTDSIIDRSITEYNDDGLQKVGDCSFYECSALTSVDFPAATSIGQGTFQNCSKLTSVDFPVATSIGRYAFSGCSKLTSVDFPVATSTGNNAFSGCTALTSVDFPVATSTGNNAFSGCTALTSVEFPVATSIGQYAFSSCSKLTSVDFPVATSIGQHAFSNCSKLTTVILRSETLCTLANTNAFSYCYHILGTKNSTYNPNGDKDGYIYVPSTLVESYKTATNWSTYATQFRALEDYTVDGTITGALDETKI